MPDAPHSHHHAVSTRRGRKWRAATVRKARWTWSLWACTALGACQPSAPSGKAPAQTTAKAQTTPPHCLPFETSRGGVVRSPEMREISGITPSTTLPGAIWAHNDSGDTPRLFAMGRDGELHGQVTLEGAEAIDWEDISAAPGRNGNPRDLIVADVGDNFGRRQSVQLYRIAEPGPADLGGSVPTLRYDLRYVDGPVDVESVFVDPHDGAVYLVAKQLLGRAAVYRAELPETPGRVLARRVARVRISTATAADMSADGTRLVIRNYRAAWLWEHRPGSSLVATLARRPCRLALPPEPQGEAIAFVDSTTLLSLSEAANQPLYVLQQPREAMHLGH